jgi:hypothetical protein
MTQQLKLGFMQDKDQQNMSIADVYSVIGNPTNARIYYENCNITQNQRHYLFATALLNAEEYANNKDYNNLPIITNLVFYSKLNYEIGTAYNIGNENALCRNW